MAEARAKNKIRDLAGGTANQLNDLFISKRTIKFKFERNCFAFIVLSIFKKKIPIACDILQFFSKKKEYGDKKKTEKIVTDFFDKCSIN